MAKDETYVAAPRQAKAKGRKREVTKRSIMLRVKGAETQFGTEHAFRTETLDQIEADGKSIGLTLDLKALRG
jgi:hypothetical protein